ncbi:hypothetical protein V5O48_011550 [Marasmius crinis-equi]|uniref:Uncharacterized protein n=1 Tax=Marasmius crinis-equi TaxID=585013 RepID=A0ABR3F5M3_9AGAR
MSLLQVVKIMPYFTKECFKSYWASQVILQQFINRRKNIKNPRQVPKKTYNKFKGIEPRVWELDGEGNLTLEAGSEAGVEDDGDAGEDEEGAGNQEDGNEEDD